MGWEILEEFIEVDEGTSGSTLDGRTGLRTLIALAECRLRPFDVILLSDSSRLGRNFTDVLNTIEKLRNHGAAIYVAGLGIDSGSESFPHLDVEKLTVNEIYRPSRPAKLHGCWRAVREFFGVLFRGSIFI